MEENIGPILTETRIEVLQDEYDRGTRQAENDHRRKIRNRTKGALRDLSYLFDHIGQDELAKAFGEGYGGESGIVSYRKDRKGNDQLGWVSSDFFAKHFDDEGNPRDPEYNPDAKTEWERYLEKFDEQNKASPETQRNLIDCVALICRAAEAGELDVHEVIERGVERYYRGHPSEDSELVSIKSWSERRWSGGIIANAVGSSSLNVPDAGGALYRFLNREADRVKTYEKEIGELRDRAEDRYGPDDFTVEQGTINYGDAPPEIDDETREAVMGVLIEHTSATTVDGLLANNDIDSPLPAAALLGWLHSRHETDTKALADEAGVSVATFQRVLSQYDDEIKSELANEYDDIEHYVTDPLGWTDETDDE